MTFLDSIASIPPILESMVRSRSERMDSLMDVIAGCGHKRAVFIGSGSSYNGALAACPLFDRLGIEAQPVFPNQFTSYATSFDRDALYVVISQGGATRLVYEAVEKLHEAGCTVCSITADVESPIAAASDVAIEMGCGEERFLYRTVGVCTTILSCWQLAISMGIESGTVSEAGASQMDDEILSVIGVMPERMDRALAWYDRHRFSLMRADYLMCAGSDDLWAVAREADIKAMEMVPMVTRSFELEEIIHGPQNAFDASGAYLIFARKGADADKARAIATFLNEEIGFCALVGGVGTGSRDFVFEEASELFGALEHLTFAQVLAYRLADDHGRDLARRLNAGISAYISKEL